MTISINKQLAGHSATIKKAENQKMKEEREIYYGKTETTFCLIFNCMLHQPDRVLPEQA